MTLLFSRKPTHTHTPKKPQPNEIQHPWFFFSLWNKQHPSQLPQNLCHLPCHYYTLHLPLHYDQTFNYPPTCIPLILPPATLTTSPIQPNGFLLWLNPFVSPQDAQEESHRLLLLLLLSFLLFVFLKLSDHHSDCKMLILFRNSQGGYPLDFPLLLLTRSHKSKNVITWPPEEVIR